MKPGHRSSLIAAAQARVGNDPIFALNAEANRRLESGESILNATLGVLTDDDGRLAAMPTVAEAMSRIASARAAAYAPISGDPAFVEAAIADLFGNDGLSDRAVGAATPGGTGAIYQAMVNFLEPGQRALTSSYFWGPYSVIADHSGRGIDTFSTFTEDHGLDLTALESALERHIEAQGRALLILNFPCHNPTGYSLDAGEWSQVAEIVRRAGALAPVTVLLDCAYMRFGGTDTNRWLDALPRMLETSTVLLAWTASKSFAQYGARIGALVALHHEPAERERLTNAFGYTCRATWSNCNHLGQLAITELLTDVDLRARADAERARLVRLLRGRVDAFNALALPAGLDVPRYEGGFFVSVFTTDAEATAAAMRDEGVFVVPMDGAVRAALCATPEADVPRLVDALSLGSKVAG